MVKSRLDMAVADALYRTVLAVGTTQPHCLNGTSLFSICSDMRADEILPKAMGLSQHRLSLCPQR